MPEMQTEWNVGLPTVARQQARVDRMLTSIRERRPEEVLP